MHMTVDHARDQARAQLSHIVELMKRIAKPDEDGDEAATEIAETPLSIEIRDGWRFPGTMEGTHEPIEYKILLCTGGPAVRIVGGLDQYCEPEDARLQYQDWGTPWTDFRIENEEHRQALLDFTRQFYFGE